MHPSDERSDGDQPVAPPPLTVACAVIGVEAALFVLYALALAPTLSGQRLMMGVTTLAFFVVYGVLLAFAALRLRALQSWARAPLVLAQLIQIMVGFSFWGGSTTLLSLGIVVLGLLALAGIFHPASLRALESAD